MTIRVFYSWQSDRRQNRNFIRSVFEVAIKDIQQDMSLEEAQRDIILDQDTQDLPGSPAIADAILTKIRGSDVFVADLTFVDNDQGRRTPNPNVMLEYGYALHAIGDAKIIGLFNEVYGTPEQLPFDLAHRRWPIRFNLPEKASDQRNDEKRRLISIVKDALRAIVSQFGDRGQTSDIAPFQPREPGDNIGRLRAAHDFLCLTADEGKPVWLPQGPYAFLRLLPTRAIQELGEVEAYRIAQAQLRPMGGMRGASWTTARHETGAVSYWALREKPQTALDASQLFLTRELWANDFYHVDPNAERAKELQFSYIPTGAIEEVFIDTMIGFTDVARNHLALEPPVQILAGLAGVQGFRLAVDPNYFGHSKFAGRIVKNNINFESILGDWSADLFDFLLPLFERIYDAAGEIRPPIRTIGQRQR